MYRFFPKQSEKSRFVLKDGSRFVSQDGSKFFGDCLGSDLDFWGCFGSV